MGSDERHWHKERFLQKLHVPIEAPLAPRPPSSVVLYYSKDMAFGDKDLGKIGTCCFGRFLEVTRML